MADLAQMPTTLNLPALDSVPSSQEEGQFTAAMKTAFSQHEELRRLYALALTEIEHLNKQLVDLRAGHGVQVIIEGRKFVPAEVAHLVQDALNQPGEKSLHGQNGLADSFVL